MSMVAQPGRATADDGAADDVVLSVRCLETHFHLRRGTLRAVDGISFDLRRGQTLCLVGESGSGKSITGRSILQIASPARIVGGQVLLRRAAGSDEVIDLAQLDPRGKTIRDIRGRDVAMIFQEPLSSLSPVHTIGFQIEEALTLHTGLTREQRRERVIELLRQVEIADPDSAVQRYPFEFSGGMRQRVMIALAIACNPKVLIADEPTTALDVTTQAEVLDLLRGLQRRLGMAMLFITHDMGVVAEIADNVAVMLRGKIVEQSPVDRIFHDPQHPYTRKLIASVDKLQKPKGSGFLDAGPRPLLQVSGLSKTYLSRGNFFGGSRKEVRALSDVGFTVAEGETLGIVGESGSGKTTLGRTLLGLVKPDGGSIRFSLKDGRTVDLAAMDPMDRRQVYREVRMVFQDPFASLNPRMTVQQIIGEPLLLNGTPRRQIRPKVAELLTRVGLQPEVMERYPHAFSGGQRQRIGIARALAVSPRLVVADEPTSALDVSLRAQMLDLLNSLKAELGLSFVFISHDLSVVRYFCDRVAVMHRGRIVEIGGTEAVCTAPQHPYTKALLSAVPLPDPRRRTMAHRYRYNEAQA